MGQVPWVEVSEDGVATEMGLDWFESNDRCDRWDTEWWSVWCDGWAGGRRWCEAI